MMIQQVGFSPKKWLTWNIVRTFRFWLTKWISCRKQDFRDPALSIQFWKGQDSCPTLLGLDLNQGRPFPSLNVPTCVFLENNLVPGELKLKTLNMEHFVQRQSGDSFCDQLLINYGTKFSKKNSSIQNGSISIGRSYSKIAFLGLRKGTPFEPQFCAQKWRNHNLGEEPGKPKPSISARTPLCKSYCFGLTKGKSPCGNSMHPGDFGRNAIFTVNCGTKGG